MTRTSLSLAGGLATALLLATAPMAQAAVTGKDLPKEADVVAAFPELAGAEFAPSKVKKASLPSTSCGEAILVKVKSGSMNIGSSAAIYPIVQLVAVEFKTEAEAKAYMADYKKYAKKCASYTSAETGAANVVTQGKNLRLGDQSLTVDSQSTFASGTNYSSSVIIRDGKRVGTVVAVDDAAVPAATIKPLAKIAAKKLK